MELEIVRAEHEVTNQENHKKFELQKEMLETLYSDLDHRIERVVYRNMPGGLNKEEPDSSAAEKILENVVTKNEFNAQLEKKASHKNMVDCLKSVEVVQNQLK